MPAGSTRADYGALALASAFTRLPDVAAEAREKAARQ